MEKIINNVIDLKYVMKEKKLKKLKAKLSWGLIPVIYDIIFLGISPMMLGALSLIIPFLAFPLFIVGEMGWLTVLFYFPEDLKKYKELKKQVNKLEEELLL